MPSLCRCFYGQYWEEFHLHQPMIYSYFLATHLHNQLRAINMNGAGVSPPDDSLIYGCEASQRQGLTGSMSSDLRAAARDRVRHLSALSSHIGGCLLFPPGLSDCAPRPHFARPRREMRPCPSRPVPSLRIFDSMSTLRLLVGGIAMILPFPFNTNNLHRL